MEQVSLETIREVLDKALLGKVFAKVFYGEGEMIYIGFGPHVLPREVREHHKRPGEFFFRAQGEPEHYLSTFFSHWQVEDIRGVLLRSEDDPNVELMAAVFLGRRVTNWHLHEDGDLDIEFDGIVTLAVCSSREEATEGEMEEAWSLSAYDGEAEIGSWGVTTFGKAYQYGLNESLRYGPDGQFSQEASE